MKKILGGDGINIIPSSVIFYPSELMDVSSEHASVVAVNPGTFLSPYDYWFAGLVIAS